MKDYIVWYKDSEHSEDMVRGVARNYRMAEEMAHSLYIDRRSYGLDIFSTGVTKLFSGELYRDGEGSMRWTVIEQGLDVRDS